MPSRVPPRPAQRQPVTPAPTSSPVKPIPPPLTVQEKLMRAIGLLDASTLEQMLDDPASTRRGMDVNRYDPANGNTPMGQAAQKGWVDGLMLLRQHGANPALQPRGARFAPLHLAALHGRLRAVDWLVQAAGVSVDQRTNQGWTALHLVADQGDAVMVQHLLDLGAGRDLLTESREAMAAGGAPSSALDLAQRKGHGPVVALFEAPLLRALADDLAPTGSLDGRPRARL